MPLSTLDDVRAFVSALAAKLDPNSRYVPELLAIVNGCESAAQLEERLAENSRGARHAGAAVFARMTLEDRLRCNLVTNETVLFRFGEGEWEVLQKEVARFRASGRPGRVLCAPCSHGEEAFSVAAACLHAGVDFAIDALDVQPACIEIARTGRMTLGFPDAYLDSPAMVSRVVLQRIDFAVADLLEPDSLSRGPWDLVVCRNFLGYFIEPVALELGHRLATGVDRGGALFVDSYCLAKFAPLEARLTGAGLVRQGAAPVFVRR